MVDDHLSPIPPIPSAHDQVADLAEQLTSLASQLRDSEPRRVYDALVDIEEAELSFMEAVDRLVAWTTSTTDEEEQARQLVGEAVRRADEPHDWPEIAADEFVVTIDFDSDPDDACRPILVFRVGEQEIYRRPTWYENGNHINMACRDMRDAYRGRVRDFEVTPGAENGIYLDDWRAGAKLKRAFRPLRKDYMRRRAEMKRAAEHNGGDC